MNYFAPRDDFKTIELSLPPSAISDREHSLSMTCDGAIYLLCCNRAAAIHELMKLTFRAGLSMRSAM